MLNRRRFLKSSATFSGGLSFGLASAAFSSSQKTMPGLHDQIIRDVKKLRGERNITLQILHPDGSEANLLPLTEHFEAGTGVKVKLNRIGLDDINNSIIFKASKNEYYFDIALPATFGIPDLASTQALRPLDDFTKKYEPEEYKELQLYDYGDYFDDTFYGYQTDGDTYLMFYNKAMMDDKNNQQAFLDKHGYPLSLPNTWEQLDTMIQFFHQPNKQQYGGCLFRIPGYGAWEWWSRFHAKGFYPLDDKLNPQINNEAGIQALQEMLDVSTFLHPKTASDGLFENWATFSEGQTFCNIGWGGSQKYFNRPGSAIKNNLYYSPAPGGMVNGQLIKCPIFNWGWNYVVSSLSKEPEIAYLFTLYACSPVMSTLSVQQADGFFDPFREEHYQDANIELTYSADFLDAHKESMKKSVPDFYLQNQSKYLSVLQENIHLAYRGLLSAQQALDLTAAKWRLINNNVGVNKQQKLWASLKKKYPQGLQKVLR